MKKEPEARPTKWKKPLLLAGGFLLICGVVAALFVSSKLSQIRQYEPQATVAPQDETFEDDTQAPPDSSAPAVDPGTVTWPADIEPVTDRNIINILLVGQDRRPNQPRQRSDSMIIVSYNRTTKTVSMVSLMRDMYIRIPGYSDNRINAAYAFGGFDLLDRTITQNFGVTIDGNVEADFEGFTDIIDILGGVDLELNGQEAAFLNRQNGWNLSAGMNHLNGKETLAYTIIREVGNADYERTERQRDVLTLLINKILALSPAEQLKLIDVVLPHLTTDLSKERILSYGVTVLKNGIAEKKQYRIPANNTYSPATIRGMYVLLPDLKKNQALLKEYLDY